MCETSRSETYFEIGVSGSSRLTCDGFCVPASTELLTVRSVRSFAACFQQQVREARESISGSREPSVLRDVSSTLLMSPSLRHKLPRNTFNLVSVHRKALSTQCGAALCTYVHDHEHASYEVVTR